MMTTLVNSAFGLAFWLIGARLFDAHTVGVTAAITSAGTIIVLLASLGVGGALIYILPKQSLTPKWSLTFWAGMAIAFVASIVAAATTTFVLPRVLGQLNALQQWTCAVVFVVGTVATTSGAVVDYVFMAERAAGNMFSRNAVVAALKVALVVVFTVVAGTKFLNLLDAWAAAAVVGLVLGSVLLRRRVQVERVAPALLTRTTRNLGSLIGGHQLIGMGAAMLPYLLPVIVTARLTASDNAYFYTTWMTAGIFLIISPALGQSLFAEGAHDSESLNHGARTALGTIGAILVPSIVVLLIAGGWLLSIFGPAYERHGLTLLRIVLFASIPDAITNVYVSVLRVRGRLAVAASLNLIMGLGILGLSWSLLPILGISAVGWAFLGMQTAGVAFVAFDIRRQATRVGVESKPTYASN